MQNFSYNSNLQQCCGYGNGMVCSRFGEYCMEGICRPRNCGGQCCYSNQFCCGGNEEGECYDAGRVCCFYIAPPFNQYYCASPCRDEVVDTESCDESKKENEKCPGYTHGMIPPFCRDFCWIDYTGLKIKQCYDGCPQRDWNLRNEICYERKKCAGSFKDNHMCLVCQDELVCVPMLSSNPPACSFGAAECILQVSCAFLVNCEKCSPTNKVVETHYRETCDCK